MQALNLTLGASGMKHIGPTAGNTREEETGQATLESLPKTQTRYGADNMVGLKKVDSGCVWGSG